MMADQLSYLSTPMACNYMYDSLPDRLRVLAKQDGDREAFVFYDINWKREAVSRQQLLDQTTSLARVLVKDGLRQGAPVGFCMRNSINMLIANFAVISAGGIPFFMGTNLKDGSDVIETLKQMDCELFIVDTDEHDDNWKILDIIWPLSSSPSCVTTLKAVICHGNIPETTPNRTSLDILLQRQEDEVPLPSIQAEDVLAYFCTSGSTGKPKEVVYNHYGMFNWVKQSNHILKVGDKTRVFFDRTFSWAGGYPKHYIADGATRIFVDPRLTLMGCDTEKLSHVICSEKCDVAVVPGYIAVDLLSKPHLSKQFENVQGMILGGERAPAAHAVLKGKFCKHLYVFYGTTEAGGACIFEGDSVGKYEDGIIGKPIGGYEIKIIDEKGSVVPRGVQGELCIRGTGGFDGYRGNEALTRATRDCSHWFHSGDVAHVRPDGNVVVDGRKQEMISMQTNKFFPWSVEKVLAKMPGVQRAFAVGMPDERFHQVFCACVVPEEGVDVTADDVKQYCEGVFRAESTTFGVTTKPVYHIVLETVPLLATGKVDRCTIAKIAKERLCL